jgi:hypothetical protein
MEAHASLRSKCANQSGDSCVELRGTGSEWRWKNRSNQIPNKTIPPKAATHIASAHQILKALQEEIGEHPELGVAILKLEMALNIQTIKTGGLL